MAVSTPSESLITPDPDHLIWVDLEMTGLDPARDRILELATLITDKELRTIATGPVFAVFQSEEVLATMDSWNVCHHSASGLIQRVRDSSVSEAEAEAATLAFLRRFVPERSSPMCGNSICQDRRFLARWMPSLEAWFHYRQVDVSSLKELARRWAPAVASDFRKESAHRALADIEDSIAELRHYRARLFRPEWGGE